MSKSGWRYEVPLFYLILAGLQISLRPSGVFLERLVPHPYWLGVLLFAGRYGMNAGLLAGALSTALLSGSVWASGERYRLEDADFYFQPALFLAVGAALGAAVDRLGRRLEGLKAALGLADDRLKVLGDELKVQQKVTRAVEQQVVSQMSSLVTLFHGSRELGHLNRKELFTGILEFFTEALQANKAALYRREGDRWVLYSQKGWETGESFPSTLEHGQGLVGKAGAENRLVSLREWFAGDLEKAWEGRAKADAVMAGPLHGEDGEVIGVFAVQELPFLRFNSAALNLLTLLLDWADEAIGKSLYFEQLKSQSVFDEVLGVYNEGYFRTRGEQELWRGKNLAQPFSLLLVRADGLSGASSSAQVAYQRALGRLVGSSCRPIDVVTKFPDPDVPFAVLMLPAGREQALELKTKILDGASRLGLDKAAAGAAAPRLSVGVGVYEASMSSMEDMIAAARKDLG